MSEKIKNIDGEMKLEEAMARLDEVVKRLDAEGSDLEESLKLYEEGIRLVRICNERLTDAERKIKLLRVSAEGEITEENFTVAESDRI